MKTSRFMLSLALCLVSGIALGEDLDDQAWAKIAASYKACIKDELIASTNDDGTLDQTFFLEGKEHCDKIKTLQVRSARAEHRLATSQKRISKMTTDLISGAKRELGLE